MFNSKSSTGQIATFFLADNVDFADSLGFFADSLTFFYDGWATSNAAAQVFFASAAQRQRPR